MNSEQIQRKCFLPKETNLVFYHKNCLDGFGAAFAAFRCVGHNAKYIPVNVSKYRDTTVPELNENDRVVIMDICFSKAKIQKMIEQTKGNVLVLDHHASAERELKDIPDTFKHFSSSHSACILAWKFFQPHCPIPYIYQLIEDKDLWRWKLPQSKAFDASFRNAPMDFKSWTDMFNMNDLHMNHFIQGHMLQGKSILQYQMKLVEIVGRHVTPCTFKKFPKLKVGIVNSSILQSKIGNHISSMKEYDIGAVWIYIHKEKTYRVSLRAINNVDVSEIAVFYKGGGHKNASGFTCKSLDHVFDFP